MPCTPYHFGPSGLVGYVFGKWIDLPVFVLANVAVDIEVAVINYFHLGRPYHRLCHTLLIGTAVGIGWGAIAYFLIPLFKHLMEIAKVKYKSGFLKVMISAILGVWFHVLIDAIYRYDVKIFWPMKKNPLWRLFSQSQIRWFCVICFVILALLYGWSLFAKNRKNKKPVISK